MGTQGWSEFNVVSVLKLEMGRNKNFLLSVPQGGRSDLNFIFESAVILTDL